MTIVNKYKYIEKASLKKNSLKEKDVFEVTTQNGKSGYIELHRVIFPKSFI